MTDDDMFADRAVSEMSVAAGNPEKLMSNRLFVILSGLIHASHNQTQVTITEQNIP